MSASRIATSTCRFCDEPVARTDERCPACNKRLRPLKARDTAQEAPAAPLPPALELDVDGCQICGRGPACEVSFRQITGMVVMFRTERFMGRFCRDCGRALFRKTTDRTLKTGWWGIVAFFGNLLTLARNAAAYRKIAALGVPHGEGNEPLDVGKPLYKRMGVRVAAALFVVGGLLLSISWDDPSSEDYVGKCIVVDGGERKVKTVPCADNHDGKVIATAGRLSECPNGTDAAFRLKIDSDHTLCVDTDR